MSLTDRQKTVLSYFETPTTTRDVADDLGISRSAVNNHMGTLREAGVSFRRIPDSGAWVIDEAPDGVDADPDADTSEDTTDDPEGEDGENITTLTTSDTGEPTTDDLPNAFINALQGNGLTYEDMNRRFGFGRDKAKRLLNRMSEAGWAIEFDTVDKHGTRRYYVPDERDKRYQIGDGDGTYIFGLISDTHLGSTATHLSDLHDFYDRLEERGVEIVLHGGDISDGWEVHKNQINEVKAQATGWKRLEDYCVNNYPQREGITTLFISGNHDRKLWRRTGVRFSEKLANRRDDLQWLGDSMARLVFDPENNIDLELIHPSGGQPYTLGYRAQTLYREQPTDVRPSMSAIAHLHGRLWAAAEGVEAWYSGCWKDLTTYGRRKGHAAEIGGWIVELTIEGGEIDEIVTSWVSYESDDEADTGHLQDVHELIDGDMTADASGAADLFTT